ncbi:MAG: hypothetical protein ACREC8_00640, partial [Limisphaerales bacterium]
MKRKLLTSVWAVFLLCAAGIMTTQANTIITFSVDMATNLANGSFNPPPNGSDAVYVFGTFNGFASPGVQLVQVGSSSVFTNTVNDTGDANGNTMSYAFNINGTVEPLSCYDNRAVHLPANSGASLVLPTQYYGGDGPVVSTQVKFQVDMSEEIELGHFNPGNGDTVVVAGSFNGWSPTAGSQYVLTNDPSIIVTNNNFTPPVIESNVYTATIPITTCANPGTGSGGLAVTNENQEWKYVEDPSETWESPGPTSADDAGNRFFTENTDQVLPLVSFSDLPYAPLATVTLNIDMSGPIKYDTNFVQNSVVVWGTFNNWASGVAMTNDPAPNTNIYSAAISMGEETPIIIQCRYTNSFINYFVYDYTQDGGPSYFDNNNYRRTITLPITDTLLVTNLSPFYFDDLAPGDYLTQPTPVRFTVDMTGAVGTDAHVFNPSLDGVYINGMFAGGTPSEPNNGTAQSWYPWSSGVDPVAAPPGYQMLEVGSSMIYTNTIVLPAGTPVALSYQYGMDQNSFSGGPSDDEATVEAVHYRVVRATGLNPYVLPTDTFTNAPYQEPFFSTGNIMGIGNIAGGNLNVGTPVGGEVPVSWLGRPGAHLQSAASLTGSWTDYPNTDGTNWTAGSSTTNG